MHINISNYFFFHPHNFRFDTCQLLHFSGLCGPLMAGGICNICFKVDNHEEISPYQFSRLLAHLWESQHHWWRHGHPDPGLSSSKGEPKTFNFLSTSQIRSSQSPLYWRVSSTVLPSGRRRRDSQLWWSPGCGQSPGTLSPPAWLYLGAPPGGSGEPQSGKLK